MQIFFDETSCPLWKQLETTLISDSLIKCVLCSNLRKNNRLISSLVPLRFMLLGLHAAKQLLSYNSEVERFLWLNSAVKHKRRPLYIEEFVAAGVYYHAQLLEMNNYLCFDDFCRKFNLDNNHDMFLKYLTLYSAIPESWENNELSPIADNHCLDLQQIVKDRGNGLWKSTKKSILIYYGIPTLPSNKSDGQISSP